MFKISKKLFVAKIGYHGRWKGSYREVAVAVDRSNHTSDQSRGKSGAVGT